MEVNNVNLTGNRTRTAILRVISLIPGVHFRALRKILGIPNGSLQYHLDILENRGLIKRFKGYGYTRFYPQDYRGVNPSLAGVVTHPTVEKILIMMLKREEVTLREVSESLGITASTALWHLRRLEKAGIVTKETSRGRKHVYRLRSREEIKKLLESYRPSLIEKLSNSWIELWDLKI